MEYVVPFTNAPRRPPEGLFGDADGSDHNEDFGLWTLHAWSYEYNPDGVRTLQPARS